MIPEKYYINSYGRRLLNYFTVFKIGQSYGLNGENKLYKLGDLNVGKLNQTQFLLLDSQNCFRSYVDVNLRSDASNIYGRLENVGSKEEAQNYVNFYLALFRKDLPVLSKDTYYIEDLISCKVIDDIYGNIGYVKDVKQDGSQDIYIVDRHEIGKKDLLIPVLALSKNEINIEEGYIKLFLPTGLWEIYE